MKKPGILVDIDGVDGVGKTTFIAALAAELEAEGRKVKIVREPGGTGFGQKIRALLSSETLLPATQLMLFVADRLENNREILYDLNKFDIVLKDRGMRSTFVYQHDAFGADYQFVEALCALSLTAPDFDNAPVLTDFNRYTLTPGALGTKLLVPDIFVELRSNHALTRIRETKKSDMQAFDPRTQEEIDRLSDLFKDANELAMYTVSAHNDDPEALAGRKKYGSVVRLRNDTSEDLAQNVEALKEIIDSI